MTVGERSTRNQRLVAEFPYAVVGWAPEEVRALAESRGSSLTLEEAKEILVSKERLIKGAMEAAGRDFFLGIFNERGLLRSQRPSELVAGPLTGEQMLQEVPEIANLFASRGMEILLVEFGLYSTVDSDELWKQFEVPASDLSTFITVRVKKNALSLGSGDLFIGDRERTILFKLCHESDIHLMTENKAFLEQVEHLWTAKGFRTLVA